MFKFLRSLQFSTAAAPFYIPTHSAQGRSVSTSSPSLALVVNSDHPAGCEAVRLCGFDLHLPTVSEAEHLSKCPSSICGSSLETGLFKPLAHVSVTFFCFVVVDL